MTAARVIFIVNDSNAIAGSSVRFRLASENFSLADVHFSVKWQFDTAIVIANSDSVTYTFGSMRRHSIAATLFDSTDNVNLTAQSTINIARPDWKNYRNVLIEFVGNNYYTQSGDDCPLCPKQFNDVRHRDSISITDSVRNLDKSKGTFTGLLSDSILELTSLFFSAGASIGYAGYTESIVCQKLPSIFATTDSLGFGLTGAQLFKNFKFLFECGISIQPLGKPGTYGSYSYSETDTSKLPVPSIRVVFYR